MLLEKHFRLCHYEVRSLIGKGGMGEVYRAYDTKLHRDVALKLLPHHVAADAAMAARFHREARAVAALNHPNIVTIHSVEEWDGMLFLTMELVEGRTLAEIPSGTGMGAEAFFAIALPLADALAVAHANGITHRDLKPQNVMLRADGCVKVLDFGLAKFAEAHAVANETIANNVTRTFLTQAAVVGTLPYMSPEQAEGSAVDVRSDVFSLGVIFYEMVGGRRPFAGLTAGALLAAILRDKPTPIRTLAPALPPALHDVIDRCMAKCPAERFADAGALHRALEQSRIKPGRIYPSAGPSAGSRADRPPTVGRDAEYGKLAKHLDGAAAGHGGLVLLAGEPGVGKTRLAEELLRDARYQGMMALTGRCYEEGTNSFSPFVEVLEQMMRDVPASLLSEALGEHAADIARLAPKIRSVCHDLPEPAVLDPEQQRRLMFNAVLQLFSRIAERKPMVVLLDDLHWAGDGTAGLLQHLAPHLSSLPMLFVGTYRNIDSEVGKPFAKAIPDLLRLQGTNRIVVDSLPQPAVADLLAVLAGGARPPSAIVQAIFEDTEGNPLFVGEVFRHLSEEGQLFERDGLWKIHLTVDELDVPETVRLVIGRRIEKLSAATSSMLRTAAVVGRHFELRVVEALSKLDGEAFLEAIEEAESAKLIVPERVGRRTRYVFTHELIRSTLLSSLSLARRQRMEAQTARTIQTLYAANLKDHTAAIAHHLYEAGPAADENETVHYLILASDEAMSAGALEKGLQLIERALPIAPAGDTRTSVMLRWKHGLALRSVGNLGQAIEVWETALRQAKADTDADVTTALCQELAHSYAWSGQSALGVRAAKWGLERNGREPNRNRCRLLGSMAWNLSIGCEFEAADPLMREATQLAKSLGDAQLLGESLLLESWHYYLCMRRLEQAQACREAIQLLRSTGDVGRLGEALGNLQMASLQIGRPRDIADTQAETRMLADRLGRFDVRVHQLFTETQRDWIIEGDLTSWRAALEDVERVAGAWRWIAEACQAQSLLWSGQMDAALNCARSSVSHEPENTHIGMGWGMLFLCECSAGRREQALSLLDHNEMRLPKAGRLNSIGSWSALFKVIEGLALLGQENASRAGTFYPLVLEALEAGTVATFDASHLVETIAGIAASCNLDWDLAESHYQTAIRIAEEMPFRSERAEARCWYARMLLQRKAAGDCGKAKPLLEEAVKACIQDKMPLHVTRAETLLADLPS